MSNQLLVFWWYNQPKNMRAILLLVLFFIFSPSSFAQESTDSGVWNPNKVIPTPKPYDWCNENGCGYGNPNPTLPPEMKCGACAWLITTKTETSPPTSQPSSGEAPSNYTTPSYPTPEGQILGEQTAPTPTAKPKPKVIYKPSPTASATASSSATPSATPVSTPQTEIKSGGLIQKFISWIIGIFANK